MTTPLFSDFLSYIHTQRLFTKKERLLVAVSGGVDSVVLAHLCHAAGFDFRIAHCNFGLRGVESDADASFVAQLCERLGVACELKTFDTEGYASERGIGIQEAARKLRYDWFASLGADRILTAHHADDNIETLLLHLFRGTGIEGLQGIPVRNGNIVRPLLSARRADILEWARDNAIQWREDASNRENKYRRNFIRNELLPRIETVFPKVREALLTDIGRFQEVDRLYRQSLDRLLKKLVHKSGSEVRLPVAALQKSEFAETVLWEVSRHMGFTPGQVSGLYALLASDSGAFITSDTHQAVRHSAWLIFAPLKGEVPSLHVIEREDDAVYFGGQELRLEWEGRPDKIDTSPMTALLDARSLDFPLILRRWKAGDYFYPLGMRKKKKLARFFIDNKLSKIDKEGVWVLESHKRIVWIVGHRIDDRFKITDGTRQVLRLSLSAAAR